MPATTKPKTDCTSIISLNIRGIQFGGDRVQTRLRPFYDYVAQHVISEVHLQEVFTYGMLRDVMKQLPSLQYATYSRGWAGPKSGLVSLYKEPAEESSFHALVPELATRLDVLHLIPYIHKGILVSHLPGGQLRLNLHLSPNHSGDWDRKSVQTTLIEQQLRQVSEILREQLEQHAVEDAVVMGDFNLPQTSQAYVSFVKDLGLVDAFQNDSTPTYQPAFLPKGRTAHQIDHLLVWSRSKEPLEGSRYIFREPVHHEGRDVYVSDHVGLSAELRLAE